VRQERNRCACALAVIAALAAAAPAVSQAEGASDDWRFTTTIYGWLPSIDGDLAIPADNGVSLGVNPSDILDALNFTFMGALEADKGRWGVATDVIYLNLGSSKKNFRDFTIGEQELPATATAKVDLDISGWLWTLGGSYLVIDDPSHPMKLLAGARMLNLGTDLKWRIEGDITGIPLPGRNGKADASDTVWDAIVGLKGRVNFGDEGKWFVPYYVDVGTGDSNFTWQGITGLGYAFGWGDLVGVWRYLDYDEISDNVDSITFDGAAVGVTFRF